MTLEDSISQSVSVCVWAFPYKDMADASDLCVDDILWMEILFFIHKPIVEVGTRMAVTSFTKQKTNEQLAS
jgi:hypothetical protein